jgi:hypothetical protein
MADTNPDSVSPKVYVPSLVLVLLLVAQVALTQDWTSGEWYNTAAIVLQAAVGYFTTDPART